MSKAIYPCCRQDENPFAPDLTQWTDKELRLAFSDHWGAMWRNHFSMNPGKIKPETIELFNAIQTEMNRRKL